MPHRRARHRRRDRGGAPARLRRHDEGEDRARPEPVALPARGSRRTQPLHRRGPRRDRLTSNQPSEKEEEMSEQDERKYPCATLDEALRELRRPPAPQAVKFKIQNAVGEYAQIAPYIDARLVYDRLDHVCGGNWSAVCEELPPALQPQRPVEPQEKLIHVRCRLTVFGVTREDVGEGAGPQGGRLRRREAGGGSVRDRPRDLRDALALAAGGRRGLGAQAKPQGPARARPPHRRVVPRPLRGLARASAASPASASRSTTATTSACPSRSGPTSRRRATDCGPSPTAPAPGVIDRSPYSRGDGGSARGDRPPGRGPRGAERRAGGRRAAADRGGRARRDRRGGAQHDARAARGP